MSKRVSRDDIDRFHDYSLYLPRRTLYMGSELYEVDTSSGTNGHMAERFIKNLHILEGMSEADSIIVLMNNEGGNFYDGMAIYDAIKTSPCFITIQVYGNAMSMGSIILQAADYRMMSPNSRQMVHYGTSSIDDHSKNAMAWAEEDKKISVWMEKIYLAKIQEKHPDYPLSKVKRMLNFDTILTAKESVELGLADEIRGKDGVE